MSTCYVLNTGANCTTASTRAHARAYAHDASCVRCIHMSTILERKPNGGTQCEMSFSGTKGGRPSQSGMNENAYNMHDGGHDASCMCCIHMSTLLERKPNGQKQIYNFIIWFQEATVSTLNIGMIIPGARRRARAYARAYAHDA